MKNKKAKWKVSRINRQQHSKLILNSSVMVFLFYGLLAALTALFLDTILPGWMQEHLLYIPIVLGLVGMSWGIYNLTYDPVVKWEKGKIAAFTIVGGSAALFIAQLVLILVRWITSVVMVYIGNAILILSCITLATGFYFFYKDLVSAFIRKLIPRNPLPLISIAFLVQAVAYSIYVASFIVTSKLLSEGVTDAVVTNVLNYIGMAFSGIFLLFLAAGFYQLFPAFRNYPKLADYLEEKYISKPKPKPKTKLKSK